MSQMLNQCLEVVSLAACRTCRTRRRGSVIATTNRCHDYSHPSIRVTPATLTSMRTNQLWGSSCTLLSSHATRSAATTTPRCLPAGDDDNSKGRHHVQENVESAVTNQSHHHDHWSTSSRARRPGALEDLVLEHPVPATQRDPAPPSRRTSDRDGSHRRRRRCPSTAADTTRRSPDQRRSVRPAADGPEVQNADQTPGGCGRGIRTHPRHTARHRLTLRVRQPGGDATNSLLRPTGHTPLRACNQIEPGGRSVRCYTGACERASPRRAGTAHRTNQRCGTGTDTCN